MARASAILTVVAGLNAAGCGKRAAYVVICPEDGNTCLAGAGRTE